MSLTCHLTFSLCLLSLLFVGISANYYSGPIPIMLYCSLNNTLAQGPSTPYCNTTLADYVHYPVFYNLYANQQFPQFVSSSVLETQPESAPGSFMYTNFNVSNCFTVMGSNIGARSPACEADLLFSTRYMTYSGNSSWCNANPTVNSNSGCNAIHFSNCFCELVLVFSVLQRAALNGHTFITNIDSLTPEATYPLVQTSLIKGENYHRRSVSDNSSCALPVTSYLVDDQLIVKLSCSVLFVVSISKSTLNNAYTYISESSAVLQVPSNYFSSSGELVVTVIVDGVNIYSNTFTVTGVTTCRVYDCIMCVNAFANWSCLPTLYKIWAVILLVLTILFIVCLLPIVFTVLQIGVYWFLIYPFKCVFNCGKNIRDTPALQDGVSIGTKIVSYFSPKSKKDKREEEAPLSNKIVKRSRVRKQIEPEDDEELKNVDLEDQSSVSIPMFDLPPELIEKYSAPGRLGRKPSLSTYSLFLLSCLAISATATVVPTCSNTQFINLDGSDCVQQSPVNSYCTIPNSIPLNFTSLGQVNCIVVYDPIGNVLASISVNLNNYYQFEDPSFLYYTAGSFGYPLTQAYCGGGANCNYTRCVNSNQADKTQGGLFNDFFLNKFPGSAGCYLSPIPQSTCNSEALGCLWYSYSLIPQGAIYNMQTFNASMITSYTVSVNITYASGQFSFYLIDPQFYPSSTLVVQNLGSVYPPTAFNCSGINMATGSMFIKNCSTFGQPIMGGLGEIQASSLDIYDSFSKYNFDPAFLNYVPGDLNPVFPRTTPVAMPSVNSSPFVTGEFTLVANSTGNFIIAPSGSMNATINLSAIKFSANKITVCPSLSQPILTGVAVLNGGVSIELTGSSICSAGLVSLSFSDSSLVLNSSVLTLSTQSSSYIIYATSPEYSASGVLTITGSGSTQTFSLFFASPAPVVDPTTAAKSGNSVVNWFQGPFTNFFEDPIKGKATTMGYFWFSLTLLAIVVFIFFSLAGAIACVRKKSKETYVKVQDTYRNNMKKKNTKSND